MSKAVLLEGAVIHDRYEVQGQLGCGAFGLVYLAHDVHTRREVAVKVLRHRWLHDTFARARFDLEAEALARIRNMRVTALLDRGVHAGHPFFVTELLRGATLRQVSWRTGLSTWRTLDLAIQVLTALHAAHLAGVVHGDVKADNVLIESAGRVDLAVLIDFGLARVRGMPCPTAPGRFFGTPAYAAPEVVRGQLPTPASDIYSAGIMLYELLTGAAPCDESSPAARLVAHVHEGIQPPSIARPDAIPPWLDAAVMRAIRPSPAERFASARAFAIALRAPAGATGSLDAHHDPRDAPTLVHRRGSRAVARKDSQQAAWREACTTRR